MAHFVSSLPARFFLAAAFCAAFIPPGAQAATPADVEKAITKGKEYLYGKMNLQNNWEATPQMDPKDGKKQWGGTSAMAVYTLLASGDKPVKEPKLSSAVTFIQDAPMIGIYAIGLRSQIWLFVPSTPQNMARVRRDASSLLRALHPATGNKPGAGYYPYWIDPIKGPQPDWWDRSVSQYGVLGVWACEQAGAEIPLAYWQLVDSAWKVGQEKAMTIAAPGVPPAPNPNMGAWRYNNEQKHEPHYTTMAAAGVATLYITQDYLMQSNNWSVCKGGANNPFIDAGMDYMDKHVGELWAGNWYGMYGVERIGVASGRKYIGAQDWYQQGTDAIVRAQAADGSFGGDVPNTCFALLFLIRGRAPIIMNKLEYELADVKLKTIPQPWNQRPRDVANFTHWSGHQSERYFNWQIIPLKGPAEDLHDAPILYISGSNPLDFDDPAIAKLRSFVEDGGTILANADCANPLFTKSITGPKGLGQRLFPKYEFRKLPENHVIYTDQQFKTAKWKVKPDVQAMSNGVREVFFVVADIDPGRSFQTRSEKTKTEAYELVQNIFLYTISRSEIRYRGDSYLVARNQNAPPAPTAIKVARLEVGDNPDPEPAAWRRLTNILHNNGKLEVTAEMVKLEAGKLTGFKVAHLTGTTKIKLNPAQQKELQAFLRKGGTLVVDAAGGSGEFADAAETELAAMFGGAPGNIGEVLPPDHVLYKWPGSPVEKIDYRAYARARISGKLNAPRVRGIEEGGRITVFYSREDLTAGLTGQPVDGVLGYGNDTAVGIMRNILLYAAAGGRAPPVTPTAPAPATVPPPPVTPGATNPPPVRPPN